MKKNIVCTLFISASIFAGSFNSLASASILTDYQVSKPDNGIKAMFENEDYQEIVDKYAGMPRNLSAEELSYIAQSYYRLDDAENASKYAVLAIQKDSKSGRALFVKGVIDGARGDYSQAEANLQKAISLSSKESDYHTALGDIYFAQDDYAKALICLQKAINCPNPSEKAYYMIGAVYANQDDMANALEAFYEAKKRVVKDKELYVTVLYNIAKLEFDNKNYKHASNAYQELTEYFPDDYYSFEKLVECCNALELYSKANEYKQTLYAAYKEGRLQPTSIFDMFCMDHFSVGENEISAYERYEEPTCRPLVKNIFYVADKNGSIKSSIYLEFVPTNEVGGAGTYKFIEVKGEERYTFNTIYDGNVTYSTLQSGVKDIVEGKAEAILYKE
ncbi:tetratricopeptide repeat protein [Dysgonomonas sp. Marseille-P4677]|uniref:tetratricopeptide repeat protein n=1 Tax=Dysgonomonas sp. Marseille-P4677 TaxID=2364790 RepID=UPI00191214F3|nr:tetratricopeptide repeat protein [Dysgonomonas sp. Marseille-P4677]MBK5722887.1 tetratricopeptide repeat protein [Dysgonomonas sp. Marseille-P4677]